MVKVEILNSMRIVWVISICFFVASTVTAQQKKKLENVKGQWVISNDITPVQARENAIYEAKVEALRQAGVPEFVSQSNLMYRADNQKHFSELFASLTSVDVSGEISEFKVTKEEKRITEFGNILYEV